MVRLTIIFLFLSLHSCSQQGVLGFNVGDDLPATPNLLTWTKVHEERFLNVVDENHVHYTSNFSSSTSNLSAVSGSAPSISGGNLVITGSVKYKSTSNPIGAWTTAELTIASMGSVGDSNKLGACIIKDATHYIAAIYDKPNTRLQIIQNDIVLGSLSHTLNTTNCKIFLVISGSSISVWYQESGDDLTLALARQSSDDLRAIDMTEYKYGVYCLQSGGSTTHNVSSLRGSASGGVGLFNDKIVRNQDGSDFILDGKLIMTADLVNPAVLGIDSYTDANSVLLSIDTTTFDVEIIGRFYFDRDSKRAGGQDLHIIWDNGQWLITYVPVDILGSGVFSDYYFYLDYADIFTEVVVPEADLTFIYFSGFPYYDASIRKIGGEYKAAVTAALNAYLFTGASLDAMTNVSQYNTDDAWECGAWIRYKATWYLMYSSFGNTKQIVLSYPAMDSVGMMDLPFVADGRIPGYDWYCKQTNGITTYYMIGFDTELYSGDWTMGNFVVWKATETKNGYEF